MKSPVDLSRPRVGAVALQGLLGGGAVVLGFWLGAHWSLTATLSLVAASGLAASLRSRWSQVTVVAASQEKPGWVRGLAWAATVGYYAGAAWLWDSLEVWEAYHAIIAWLMAGSYAAAWWSARSSAQLEWTKGVAWVWALMGSLIWVGAAYLENHAAAFHLGFAMLVALMIVWRLGFRLSGFEIQLANSVILLLIATPIVDWSLHAPGSRPAPAPSDRPYSYAVARKDPARFAVWWRHYQEAWNRMARDVFMSDPEGELPLRLRPNCQGYLLESRIKINAGGFRGAEIAPNKGDAYRIIALGESTTFGCTLEPDDLPWPELLEEWIRERLRPGRPVEVINAGVPAYNLGDNLERFERDLLPLEPDLIVSYHGYNGLAMMRDAAPRVGGPPPPAYAKRPLTLLAKLEFRLECMWPAGAVRCSRPTGSRNPPRNSTRSVMTRLNSATWQANRLMWHA